MAHGLKNENEEATKDMAKGDVLIEKLNAEILSVNSARIAAAGIDGRGRLLKRSFDHHHDGRNRNCRSRRQRRYRSVGGDGRDLRAIGSPVRAHERARARQLDTEIEGTERKDEIGQMARTVLVFRDSGLDKVRLEKAAAERRQEAEQRRLETEEERRRNAEAQAAAAQEQAYAVKALGDGLGKMSEGDLTVHLSEGFTEAYQQIKDDFNTTIGRLKETIGSIISSTREVTNASSEISTSTTDLSQRTEEQAASLEQTSASMEEMSATVKKNAENAQQANQSAQRLARHRRPRRPGGGQGGRRHGPDRGFLAQDLRHHRGDRRDRPPDQPVGAQCRGRGGACRRCRPRLCGGGLRGAQPGAALLPGRQGHQGPDHQQLEPGAGRRRAGQPDRHAR